MLERAAPVVGRVQAHAMAGLSAAERDTFVKLLSQIVS